MADAGGPPLTRVLVAGIAGASLGTEIIKVLAAAGRYEIYGCDISALAFGHYDPSVKETFVPTRDGYADEILSWCLERGIQAVVPGGEEPLRLLTRQGEDFRHAGVLVAANAPAVIERCGDKGRFFLECAARGVHIPRTVVVHTDADVPDWTHPCVVKPASGTGGSTLVSLAMTREEILAQVRHLLRLRDAVLVQEYLPEDEGEFTVGVLSLPDGRLVSSVAMRRLFHCKLSVAFRTGGAVISSGYSQGLIDDFPAIRRQCEDLARLLDSRGPLNVQGRCRDGRLLPFEVNARFSASTHLRAMAGVNEVDIFLSHVLRGGELAVPIPRWGYYLRSLSELYVPKERLKA